MTKARLTVNIRTSRMNIDLRPARIFHTAEGAFINTAASARCKDVLSLGELFQQFVSRDEKPLKRLVGRSSRLHRAEAPVLMRMGVTGYEICGLAPRVIETRVRGAGCSSAASSPVSVL
jgi:hypothetical protein